MSIFATFSATISDDVYVILFKHLESPVRIPLPIKNTETYRELCNFSHKSERKRQKKPVYSSVIGNSMAVTN